MAQQYLLDIGMNDPLENVIRKCNYNFRLSNAAQTKQSSTQIRIIDGKVDGLEARVVQNADDIADLQIAVDDLGQDLIELHDDILVINGKLERSMHYRGAVANTGALPSVNVSIGDVYYVNSDEEHMVWTGSSWLTIGGSGGSVGTTNYNDLINKPQINSVTLMGNKTFGDLGLSPIPQPNIWALF